MDIRKINSSTSNLQKNMNFPKSFNRMGADGTNRARPNGIPPVRRHSGGQILSNALGGNIRRNCSSVSDIKMGMNLPKGFKRTSSFTRIDIINDTRSNAQSSIKRYSEGVDRSPLSDALNGRGSTFNRREYENRKKSFPSITSFLFSENDTNTKSHREGVELCRRASIERERILRNVELDDSYEWHQIRAKLKGANIHTNLGTQTFMNQLFLENAQNSSRCKITSSSEVKMTTGGNLKSIAVAIKKTGQSVITAGSRVTTSSKRSHSTDNLRTLGNNFRNRTLSLAKAKGRAAEDNSWAKAKTTMRSQNTHCAENLTLKRPTRHATYEVHEQYSPTLSNIHSNFDSSQDNNGHSSLPLRDSMAREGMRGVCSNIEIANGNIASQFLGARSRCPTRVGSILSRRQPNSLASVEEGMEHSDIKNAEWNTPKKNTTATLGSTENPFQEFIEVDHTLFNRSPRYDTRGQVEGDMVTSNMGEMPFPLSKAQVKMNLTEQYDAGQVSENRPLHYTTACDRYIPVGKSLALQDNEGTLMMKSGNGDYEGDSFLPFPSETRRRSKESIKDCSNLGTSKINVANGPSRTRNSISTTPLTNVELRLQSLEESEANGNINAEWNLSGSTSTVRSESTMNPYLAFMKTNDTCLVTSLSRSAPTERSRSLKIGEKGEKKPSTLSNAQTMITSEKRSCYNNYPNFVTERTPLHHDETKFKIERNQNVEIYEDDNSFLPFPDETRRPRSITGLHSNANQLLPEATNRISVRPFSDFDVPKLNQIWPCRLRKNMVKARKEPQVPHNKKNAEWMFSESAPVNTK